MKGNVCASFGLAPFLSVLDDDWIRMTFRALHDNKVKGFKIMCRKIDKYIRNGKKDKKWFEMGDCKENYQAKDWVEGVVSW